MKKRTVARFCVLVVTSILGMAMLGVGAFTALALSLWLSHERALFVYPAFIGAIVGFLSMPFVVAYLADTCLKKSIPVVYGISLIVAAVWALLVPAGFGISSAFPAFFSVVILSRWCGTHLALPYPTERCQNCGYDLSGCKDPGCPECGWGRG